LDVGRALGQRRELAEAVEQHSTGVKGLRHLGSVDHRPFLRRVRLAHLGLVGGSRPVIQIERKALDCDVRVVHARRTPCLETAALLLELIHKGAHERDVGRLEARTEAHGNVHRKDAQIVRCHRLGRAELACPVEIGAH
jgi:hypothetical protein